MRIWEPWPDMRDWIDVGFAVVTIMAFGTLVAAVVGAVLLALG